MNTILNLVKMLGIILAAIFLFYFSISLVGGLLRFVFRFAGVAIVVVGIWYLYRRGRNCN